MKEGVDFQPAPVLARILAYLLDVVASVIITLALYRFIGGLFLNMFGSESFIGLTLSTSMWSFGGLGYWVVIPAATGATPAKMLFQLMIIPDSHRPLTLFQVIQREVIGHAVNIVTVGLGFLLALQDVKNRGLNDRIAGTRLIQFTSPQPDLYRIQDLSFDEDEGLLVSYEARVAEDTGAEPGDTEPIPDESSPDEPLPDEPDSPDDGGVHADLKVADPTGSAGDATSAPESAGTDTAETGRSLYARPKAETAHERMIRAARGPTVRDLAEALRRTAELVEQGQLMPKVLDRKRGDFVEQMRTVDLGEDPAESVQIIVELGQEGLLTRDELQQVRDILRQRLQG